MVTVDHGSADVKEAASAAIQAAGGGAKLAKLCGVTRFAVQQWKTKGIPPRHLLTVSSVLKIAPEQLRPALARPGAEQQAAA